ncbi:MAG: metallophosphoesterase family protein [Oligoflexia bacterium]|nr:metallophosphoesterase family protein [Oligoflexia bacterium]
MILKKRCKIKRLLLIVKLFMYLSFLILFSQDDILLAANIGIIGDIHCDLDTFNKSIDQMKKIDPKIDNIIITGDLIAKDCDVEKMIQAVYDGAMSVVGNNLEKITIIPGNWEDSKHESGDSIYVDKNLALDKMKILFKKSLITESCSSPTHIMIDGKKIRITHESPINLNNEDNIYKSKSPYILSNPNFKAKHIKNELPPNYDVDLDIFADTHVRTAFVYLNNVPAINPGAIGAKDWRTGSSSYSIYDTKMDKVRFFDPERGEIIEGQSVAKDLLLSKGPFSTKKDCISDKKNPTTKEKLDYLNCIARGVLEKVESESNKLSSFSLNKNIFGKSDQAFALNLKNTEFPQDNLDIAKKLEGIFKERGINIKLKSKKEIFGKNTNKISIQVEVDDITKAMTGFSQKEIDSRQLICKYLTEEIDFNSSDKKNKKKLLNAINDIFPLNEKSPLFDNEESPTNGKIIGRRFKSKHYDGLSEVVEKVLNVLKKKPFLLNSFSVLFHGSTSASLVDLIEKTTSKENSDYFLKPTGVLIKEGRAPFSGELFMGINDKNSVNQDRISTSAIQAVEGAIGYAKMGSSKKKKEEELCNVENSNLGLTQAGRLIGERRKQILSEFNGDQKKLILDQFPIVYGINPTGRKDADITMIPSDVDYEMGILNGVKISEISSVFVPSEKITYVKTLFDGKYKNNKIKVLSLEELENNKVKDVCSI